MSRNIDLIVIHCSATKPGQVCNSYIINDWHKDREFICIGYHFVILLNGEIEFGRPIEAVGAHVKGFNAHSIGICYIGGVDANLKPLDTRTYEQRRSLASLVLGLHRVYPAARVTGHRDLSHDRDCPCFDVDKWWQGLLAVGDNTLWEHRTQ